MDSIDWDIAIAITVTTLVILVLTLLVIILVLVSKKEKNAQKIKFAETRIHYEQELRKVENEVSEHVQQQFSQELHDNIGHLLTCMRISIENKKMDQQELSEVFRPVESYLDVASRQLRLLSRALNTDFIGDVGLSAAIQSEVERLTQLRRFQIHLESQGNVLLLDKNQQLMAFRIFQEMIHNSIKHAKAKNIYIHLLTIENFELTVHDDGKGFDLNGMSNSVGTSGLRNMESRAKMAGMECIVKSAIGEGCRYTLRLL